MPDLETHNLYDGTVELTYDDDAHEYYVDGEKLDGVTSSLKVIAKPALMYWAVNETIDFMRDCISPETPYSQPALRSIFKEAKTARYKTSEGALRVGSRAHDWAETYINMHLGGLPDAAKEMAEKALGYDPGEDEESQRVQSAIRAFLQWEKTHDVEYLASERVAYSKEHGYAGRGDLVARVNGALTLCDFKTSKGIYPEYYLQGSAYAKAFEEEGIYGPFDKIGVLRIPKDGSEFEYGTATQIGALYRSFLSALHLTRWKSRGKDYAETVEEKTLFG